MRVAISHKFHTNGLYEMRDGLFYDIKYGGVNIPSNEWNEALIDFGNNTEEVLKLRNTEKQGKYVRIWI